MISETMPLNEWPIEKLYRLNAILKSQVENDFVPHTSEWSDFISELRSAMNQAIKDAEQKLTELPFK